MNDVFLTQLNLGFRFISSENKIDVDSSDHKDVTG
jgi:hypothetical protein